MDLQSRINEARHPCGATCRIFREPTMPAPDLERAREAPPSAQAVCGALIRAGCTSALQWTPDVIVGVHTDEGFSIRARGTASGWLFTGGPRGMLNYGAPDASALERFPDVLASVQEYARHLEERAAR